MVTLTAVIDTDLDIQHRKAAFAQALETTEGQISTVSLDIARMRELGVLVDIDIHGTSMFTARATWSELGIPQDDTRRKRLKRGSKDLIPHIYIGRLRSLETRFRQSLEKHSFILQGFRPYRWIPFTAYESWREDWATLQAELDELKADILDHYDDFIDAIAADFALIAHEAWSAIRARRSSSFPSPSQGEGWGEGAFVLITDHGTFENLDAFTDHVISRAIAQMPPREKIQGALYVDYHNAIITTGTDLEAERLRQEQLRTASEQERAAQHATWQEARTRERQEWAKQQQLDLEVQEAEKLSHIRLRAEQRKLDAMKQAELEHARQQLSEMTSPFAEVIEQFRARIHQDVTQIAASIHKNGHVRGKVAERARSLLDLYRLLGAATDDAQLESALYELRSRLNQRPANDSTTKYDTAAVQSALTDIATLTHDAAQTVIARASAHTRASALEL